MIYTHERQKLYNSTVESIPAIICKEVGKILDIISYHKSLDDNTYYDVKVILSELLQNAVSHGNCMDCHKKITIDVWLKENRFLDISIKDQGIGFNTKTIVNGKQKCEDSFVNLDESGRGLLIISNLCDNVKYNRRGNKVTVRKELH